MKTPLEFIIETRDFYSADPSRRAIHEGCCFYFDPRTSNRCAVGRCMFPESRWNAYVGSLRKLLMHAPFAEVIQPEYQQIPLKLLEDLQNWHDSSFNFTPTGLTEWGESIINNLIQQYSK